MNWLKTIFCSSGQIEVLDRLMGSRDEVEMGEKAVKKI
jgi:hypothetical protein